MLFLISSNAGSASQWYIDSGASQHMTNSKDSMVHYQEFSSPEIVRMGIMRLKLMEGEHMD